MSQSFKKFLAEDGAGLAPGAGQFLALGAFGKHPGWDDHVEDLGLETETLILAKRVLYVQGVGGEIDTGAWEKLEPAQRVEGFNHVFVWQRAGQFLIGRMWSSSDGKGRTRYPMVVCAHYAGAPLAWGLQRALGKLEELEQACKATNTAEGVRSALDRARSGLRALLGNTGSGEAYTPASEALNQFVSAPAFGADQTGWFRIMYQIQSQMAAYAPGKFNAKDDLAQMRPQQIRVPAPGFPDEAILLWTRFFGTRVDKLVPTLAMLSKGQPWLDVVFGEPTKQEFFCLRAQPAALPLATDVPYDMDEKFKAEARRQLEEFKSGKQAANASAAEESPSMWVSITQRWFKGTKMFLWVGGGLILLASSAALVFSLSQGKNAGQAVAPPQPAASTSIASTPAPAPVPAIQPGTPKTSQATVASAQPVVPEQHEPIPKPPPVAAKVPPPQAPPQDTSPSALVQPPSGQKPVPTAPTPAAPATTVTMPATPAAPAALATAVVATSAAQASAIRKAFTNGIGMALIWVATLPGTASGAWVGKYEVTQKEFEHVTGANPSKSKNPQQPVESVTWQEAADFCHRLTASERATGTLPQGFVYALPTQDQWDAFLGDATFENAVTSRANRRDTPAPVGSFGPANEYGLCDVLGNVWEWCADSGAPQRFLKGGAYDSTKIFEWKPLERTTSRRLAADIRAPDAGFRCVAVPEP